MRRRFSRQNGGRAQILERRRFHPFDQNWDCSPLFS